MSEFVMKDLVKKAGLTSQFQIASAATSREEIGNPVYPPARRKLAEHGIACGGKTARQLTRADYVRLVNTARRKRKERLSLVLQTICATGIRVSELREITAEAVASGRAEIANKGKRRSIFLSEKLCRLLKSYLKRNGITAGPVFVTRSGRPLDRSNIWRDMKSLCESAGVEPSKVFPHNLRHLFARTYYALERDLSRLADILGHTNVTTTRIYTAESGAVHARQIGKLGLVVT